MESKDQDILSAEEQAKGYEEIIQQKEIEIERLRQENQDNT